MDAFEMEREAPDLFDGVQTGSFGIRALARIIEWVLHTMLGFCGGAIGGVVALIAEGMGLISPGWAERTQGVGFAWNLAFGLLAAFLYHVVCEGIAGTSIGKLLLGLRVVTTELAPCTPGKAVLRSLAYFVDAFFFGMVAYGSMQSSPINQRLGDKWAHTVVAKSATLPPSARRPPGMVALGLIAGVLIHGATCGLGVVLSAI